MRAIMPPIWMLFAMFLMVLMHFTMPGVTVLQPPFHFVGVGVVASALLLFGWSSRLFWKAGTAIRPFQESTMLITSGPYRVSRNPIYLAMALLLFGLAMFLGTLTPFGVLPGFMILIDRVFIRAEQIQLQATFPDEYAQYRRLVRRWI